MKQVLVKYKRYCFHRKISVPVPERWSELTEEQFKAAAENMFGKNSPETFFGKFFGFPIHVLQRLDGLQIFRLSGLIEFLSDTSLPCNKFLIPRIWNYQAPKPALSGVCLQAWMTVDTYFGYYVRTEKEEYLNYAIAALYLAGGVSFYGKRLVNLEKSAVEIAGVDLITRKAIFLNIILIKNWLSRSYPFLFPVIAPQSGQKSKGTDWLEIFDHLIGDNIPLIDDYKKMAATDAFRIMNRRIKEAKKWKK